jgi:RNA polymerase sigma factor (sigma-70 family)
MEAMRDGRTRASWIEALRRRNEAAWAQVVERFGYVIHGVFRASGLPRSDWDDLQQEVLMRLFQSLNTFVYNQSRPSFRPWLGAVVRNLVIDHYRKAANQPRPCDEETLERFSARVADAVGPLFEGHVRAAEQRLWDVVRQRVSPKMWQVHVLRAQQGRTREQVAKELGITATTVGQYESIVKATFRRVAEEMGPDLFLG